MTHSEAFRSGYEYTTVESTKDGYNFSVVVLDDGHVRAYKKMVK